MTGIVNSLVPGKFARNSRQVIFKQILVIDGWGISCEIALIWMSLDFTDDQSTLVPVMAWCSQATSHYLSQCWHRSLWPYGITRPQWVNVGYWIKWSILMKTLCWSTVHELHLDTCLCTQWEQHYLTKCDIIDMNYHLMLTHWRPVMHIGIQEIWHHWLRQ